MMLMTMTFFNCWVEDAEEVGNEINEEYIQDRKRVNNYGAVRC